jgi:hypothetical protein
LGRWGDHWDSPHQSAVHWNGIWTGGSILKWHKIALVW